ncbi:TIGR02530 family flagellar biosynthesis protein [Bacillus songklensis]|uniref:TIGR02530 family flagellar biosynthesis protein n=1 Tax=Bacillus songklensis TaxID=1069116 RepID=A0ABV8AX61_9BACI
MDRRIAHSFHTTPIPRPSIKKNVGISNHSFKDQFCSEMQKTELKISKHARERMNERDIQIGDNEWNELEEKVMEARKKGVNDSLVLMKDVALIVSAKNNTIVTAMNRDETKSQIFTNINGTIVIE